MDERWFVAVGVVLLLVLGLVPLQPRRAAWGGWYPIVGNPAPQFAVAALNGGFDTANACGRPMILAFWTTWCGVWAVKIEDLSQLLAQAGFTITP